MKWSLLLLFSVLQTVSCRFDCTHPGYECQSGGTCDFKGPCQCGTEFEGDRCQIRTKFKTPGAACQVTCLNGGICVNENQCACPYNYTGEFCQIHTSGARCALGEMIVEVYRPTGYDGEAYLKTDRTKCKLVFVGMEHGMMKYQRNVAYTDTNCPLKMTKDTPTPGDVTYTATVVYTSTRDALNPSRDTIAELSCAFKASKVAMQMDTPDSRYPIMLSARDERGDSVQAITVNDKVDLVFEPYELPDVKGVMVTDLQVYSINATTKEVRAKDLIRNGCADYNTAAMYNIPISNIDELDTATGIYRGVVKTKGFILLENEPLLFNYNLTFCPAKCVWPANCPSPPSAAVPLAPQQPAASGPQPPSMAQQPPAMMQQPPSMAQQPPAQAPGTALAG